MNSAHLPTLSKWPQHRAFHKDFQLPLDSCELLFRKLRSQNNIDSLRRFFRLLLKNQPVLNFECGRGSIFWRSRRCPSAEGFSTVNETLAPPSHLAGPGRLNGPGESMLYAATREETALTELRVNQGEFMQLCGMRIKSDGFPRLAAVGELNHVSKTGYTRIFGTDPDQIIAQSLNTLASDHGKRILYVDTFLGDILADANASKDSYIHTRALKDAIFTKLPRIDGFFYPSVEDNLGINLVVTPSAFQRHFEVTCAALIRITKKRLYGFLDWEVCLVATGIDSSGRYLWMKPTIPNQTVIFAMTEAEERFCRARGDQMQGNDLLRFLDVGRKRSMAVYT